MTRCPLIPAYFGVKCKYLKFKWNPELQKPLLRRGTQLPTAQWYSLNIYSAVFKEKLHSACKKWKIKGWWWKSDRLSKTKALDKTDKAKQREGSRAGPCDLTHLGSSFRDILKIQASRRKLLSLSQMKVSLNLPKLLEASELQSHRGMVGKRVSHKSSRWFYIYEGHVQGTKT